MEADIAREKFESFVNSEECKTALGKVVAIRRFESFVNSEECKTNSQQYNLL